MSDLISNERWVQAQDAEVNWHYHSGHGSSWANDNIQAEISFYENWYVNHYFNYMEIDTSKTYESILEIGCCMVAGCEFVSAKKKTIIEPLFTEPWMERYPHIREHKKRLEANGVEIVTDVAEDFDDYESYEEVWLMNVLQHVYSPSQILKKCRNAKTVRFFEPINLGTNECHPHQLVPELFIDSLFENSTENSWHKQYGDGVVGQYKKPAEFHQADCYYGVSNRT